MACGSAPVGAGRDDRGKGDGLGAVAAHGLLDGPGQLALGASPQALGDRLFERRVADCRRRAQKPQLVLRL